MHSPVVISSTCNKTSTLLKRKKMRTNRMLFVLLGVGLFVLASIQILYNEHKVLKDLHSDDRHRQHSQAASVNGDADADDGGADADTDTDTVLTEDNDESLPSPDDATTNSKTKFANPCISGDEPDCNTFPQLRSPKEDLEEYLTANPNSPAAHFVELLKEYLYAEPSWERERQTGCYRFWNMTKCFAGMGNYNAAPTDAARTAEELKMPFYEDTDGSEGTVFRAFHFQNTTKPMPFLGTHVVCLPLLLAGTTVTETGVVVELGPFAGLTSKCVGMGLNKARTNPPRTNALISYDTFADTANYNAITKASPWVKESYPDYTPDNDDFLPIWKDIVQYEYPTALGRKGFASSKTLSDDILGEKNLEILMIDSAKSAPALHEQTGGIAFREGTILFLMDIEKLRVQLFQVYGCLRSGFITPIYASLGMEHWGWIVLKSFHINQPWMKKCYENINNNPTEANAVILEQAKADMMFVTSGLTGEDERAKEHFGDVIDRVLTSYKDAFSGQWDNTWTGLAQIDIDSY
mmetsp:Transcript_396/g.501  ORF Transcript_396/g.501 Transcript_396/m.501 type:complete len:522 (+) Transcript_396:84-1649(+)